MDDAHDRMPVILPKEIEREWLDVEVHRDLDALSMLRPYPPEKMRAIELPKDFFKRSPAVLALPLDSA